MDSSHSVITRGNLGIYDCYVVQNTTLFDLSIDKLGEVWYNTQHGKENRRTKR